MAGLEAIESMLRVVNYLPCLHHDYKSIITILILLLQDLPKEIGNICKFLNRQYSETEINLLANHLSFKSMQKNKNVNNTVNGDDSIQFVRKGKTIPLNKSYIKIEFSIIIYKLHFSKDFDADVYNVTNNFRKNKIISLIIDLLF